MESSSGSSSPISSSVRKYKQKSNHNSYISYSDANQRSWLSTSTHLLRTASPPRRDESGAPLVLVRKPRAMSGRVWQKDWLSNKPPMAQPCIDSALWRGPDGSRARKGHYSRILSIVLREEERRKKGTQTCENVLWTPFYWTPSRDVLPTGFLLSGILYPIPLPLTLLTLSTHRRQKFVRT